MGCFCHRNARSPSHWTANLDETVNQGLKLAFHMLWQKRDLMSKRFLAAVSGVHPATRRKDKPPKPDEVAREVAISKKLRRRKM